MDKTVFDIPASEGIDLTDPVVKGVVDSTFEDWIERSELRFQEENMADIYRLMDLYYEGYHVPVGFSSDTLAEFIKKNRTTLDLTQFKINKTAPTVDDQGNVITPASEVVFVVDNKLGVVLRNLVGEYIAEKKIIKVKNDSDPTNDRIEEVVQRKLEDFEEKRQVWVNVRKPCILNAARYGLGLEQTEYSPFVKHEIGGEILDRSINPLNFRLDPTSQHDRYEDCRFIIHIKRLKLDEAKEYLKEFDVDPETVYPDSDWLSKSNKWDFLRTDMTEEFVTLYCIEYRRQVMEEAKMKLTGIDGGPAEEYPIKKKVINYYYAIYNPHLKTVWHKENKHVDKGALDDWQFSISMYIYERSALRLYPRGALEGGLIDIQDRINVSRTIIFNNARERNRFRGMVAAQLQAKYPALFAQWNKEGGWMPINYADLGIDKLSDAVAEFKTEPIAKEFYETLAMDDQSLKEQTVKENALSGNYQDENGQLSGVALNTLINQKKKSLSFFDDNIEYGATQTARRIYRIMAEEFEEQDFVAITKRKKGDPKYIPYNSIMTQMEFEQYLIDSGMVDEQSAMMLEMILPDDPMYVQKRLQVIMPAIQRFTQRNQVVFERHNPEVYGSVLEPAQMYASQMVYVNFLKNIIEDGGKIDLAGGKYDLTIKVSFDFESENAKMKEEIIMTNAWNGGKMADKLYFRDVVGKDEEWIEENAKALQEQNTALAIANVIQKLAPQQQQAVLGLVQEAASHGGAQ